MVIINLIIIKMRKKLRIQVLIYLEFKIIKLSIKNLKIMNNLQDKIIYLLVI